MITIADVEEVIARMGKPEELEPDGNEAGAKTESWEGGSCSGNAGANFSTSTEKVRHRFYRNPDDRMLGGCGERAGCLLGDGM